MMKKIILLFMAIIIAIPVFSQSVALEKKDNAVPGPVILNLDMLGFTGTNTVETVQFAINLDGALLQYTGPEDVAYQGGTILVTQVGNELNLNYTNMSGVEIDDTFIALQFNYAGGFQSDLEFAFVEITKNFVEYNPDIIDGYIKPKLDDPDGTVSLEDLDADPSGDVKVELTIDHVNGFNGLASALELHLAYDKERLAPKSSLLTNDELGFLEPNINLEAGTISLSKPTGGPFTDFPYTVELNFTYLGGGDAEIDFLPGSFVSGPGGDLLHTFFTGGTVSPPTLVEGKLTIARVRTDGGVEEDDVYEPGEKVVIPVPVSVPITASDFNSSIGTGHINITYDAEYLTYQSITQSSDWFIESHETGSLNITIKPSAAGYTFSGALFSINFLCSISEEENYKVADIEFAAGTQLFDPDISIITPGLEDGWVAKLTPGDANCDGVVNVLDATTILNFIAGLLDPEDDFCPLNADANQDGTIDVTDATKVLLITAGD